MWEDRRLGLLLSFLEGFAVTWTSFTMIVAIWFGSLVRILFKPETTPLKNAFFLLGALTGWIASYSTGGSPFYRWAGIWWIPTGLVIASALGIPVTWYFERKET